MERTLKQEPLRTEHPRVRRPLQGLRCMHSIAQSLKALHSFALIRGTAVRYAALQDGIGGYVEGGRIVLRAGLTPRQELLTLAHELTHIMAHGGSVRACTPRAICEYEAEAVEWLIAQRLGFAAPEFEFCLSESPPFPEGLLAASVTRVRGVARTLIAVVFSASAREKHSRRHAERFTRRGRPAPLEAQAAVEIDAAAREEVVLHDEERGVRDLGRITQATQRNRGNDFL
jgi:hypothetical protein